MNRPALPVSIPRNFFANLPHKLPTNIIEYLNIQTDKTRCDIKMYIEFENNVMFVACATYLFHMMRNVQFVYKRKLKSRKLHFGATSNGLLKAENFPKSQSYSNNQRFFDLKRKYGFCFGIKPQTILRIKPIHLWRFECVVKAPSE